MLFTTISQYISTLGNAEISASRREILQPISNWIKYNSSENVLRLNFICTHNSRRSQLSQVWAAFFADMYGRDNIVCHSGGTEATAFHPNAIAALERVGFSITPLTAGDNPQYRVQWREDHPGLLCYSKIYGDDIPQGDSFAAIMTCSDAEANCPFIPAAAVRLPLRYDDPKAADNTPEAIAVYDARCRQIAAEMRMLME